MGEYSENEWGMWRTSCGDRTLKGAEARLFAETLLSLLDEAASDQLEDYGIEIFDRLTYGQKISTLSAVGNALLRDDINPVGLTATSEAGIAAVFSHLWGQVLLEIDMDDTGTFWRELVVAARKEMEAGDIPEPTCDDPDEWDIEIQELSDCILWDRDYEDGARFLDKPPEESEAMRQFFRIPEDYYLAIADDLSDKEIPTKISELAGLCSSVVKN